MSVPPVNLARQAATAAQARHLETAERCGDNTSAFNIAFFDMESDTTALYVRLAKGWVIKESHRDSAAGSTIRIKVQAEQVPESQQ